MSHIVRAIHSSSPRNLIQKPASAKTIWVPCVLDFVRSRSTTAFNKPEKRVVYRDDVKQSKSRNLGVSSLSRMKASALLRNIFLGLIFTSPTLLKTTLPVVNFIAKSNSVFLDPDRNPILRAIFRPVIYNQFCAGTNELEINKTRDSIIALGFSGTALCFGKETHMTNEKGMINTGQQPASAELDYWRDGNLETLDMAKDWIGIKFTGAGADVTQALVEHKPLPPAFHEAMTAICERAKSKNCNIWIDSEQNAVQEGIDLVTIDLMRRYNRNGNILIYNTLQSYLKASRDKLKQQLALSHQEEWELAIKLVRGAYIATDPRSLIHDSKEDTDASYDGIVRDILQGTNLGFPAEKFPRMQLLIAGHNRNSVFRAFELSRALEEQGRLKVRPDFAQLQGMADELGCDLLQRFEQVRNTAPDADGLDLPRVYKCLTWGSVRECIQFLVRRMVENGGASDRIRDGLGAYVGELRRRVIGR